MRGGPTAREGHHSTSADLADAVGYARSEFRDGRSEKEVLELLLRSGQPASIRRVVHELYFECLEVTQRDRLMECFIQFLGLPLVITLFVLAPKGALTAPAMLIVLAGYFGAVHVLTRRHWAARHRRNLERQNKA